MIETLIGTLFGGVFRLVPEFVKLFDRKSEREHELAMFDKQLEADRMKIAATQHQTETLANAAMDLADVQAMIAATQAQAVKTGIGWVDAINALMRPAITFWWVIVLYSTALAARFVVLVQGGSSNIQAILTLWGPPEQAIVASIISFWFVDRSLRYTGLK